MSQCDTFMCVAQIFLDSFSNESRNGRVEPEFVPGVRRGLQERCPFASAELFASLSAMRTTDGGHGNCASAADRQCRAERSRGHHAWLRAMRLDAHAHRAGARRARAGCSARQSRAPRPGCSKAQSRNFPCTRRIAVSDAAAETDSVKGLSMLRQGASSQARRVRMDRRDCSASRQSRSGYSPRRR